MRFSGVPSISGPHCLDVSALQAPCPPAGLGLRRFWASAFRAMPSQVGLLAAALQGHGCCMLVMQYSSFRPALLCMLMYRESHHAHFCTMLLCGTLQFLHAQALMQFLRPAGTLPPSWSAMKILERLDTSQNVLSGALPHLWGLMSLAHLNLSGNTLSGQPSPCMAASMHCQDRGTGGTL